MTTHLDFGSLSKVDEENKDQKGCESALFGLDSGIQGS